MPGPRRGSWSGGGCLVPGRSAPRGGAWWRPPGTATAAGGTHPTGMHSCSENIHKYDPDRFNFKNATHIVCLLQIIENRLKTLFN